MDRLFANGTVNAAQSGKGPALFLLHSLLSDRASFDAIVPRLSRSFRVIVPELPGFGGSRAVSGGLAAVADRMAAPGREASGNMAAASRAKGLSVITGVAMRRLFAPEFQAQHPDLMRDRRDAFFRTDPEPIQAARAALTTLDLRPQLE